MSWTTEFDRTCGMVKVIYEGEISAEESIRSKEEYLASADWHPGMNILVDCRQSSLVYLGVEKIRKKILFHASHSGEYGMNRIAYLVNNLHDYGIARQITTLLEIHTDSKAAVFKEEEAAVAWLANKFHKEQTPL